MKVQLINPPVKKEYPGCSPKSGAYPPLDLICLATYLKENLPEIEIEIIDCEVTSINECENRINGDVVGLSAKILNYPNCLYLAKIAKQKGTKVILGGPYASAVPSLILQNHEDIDLVVIGDGEKALTSYLQQFPLEKIPNIAYRMNGNIQINTMQFLNLNTLPTPDFRFIDLQPYFQRFRNVYSKFIPAKNAAVIYAQKGCLWKDQTGGCLYCCVDGNYRVKNPQKVWDEISDLIEKYSIEFIWDVSDTFTQDKKWFYQFVNTKPKNVNPLFLLYARANNITEELVKALKKINCYQLLFGVQSSVYSLLKGSNIGITIDQSVKAVKLLERYKIYAFPTFMFGLPGETKETVDETLSLVNKFAEMENVFEISRAILLPLPGTRYFDMILKHPILSGKYKNKDLFDLVELQKDWLYHFCHVDYGYLCWAIEEVARIIDIPSSFAIVSDRHEKYQRDYYVKSS